MLELTAVEKVAAPPLARRRRPKLSRAETDKALRFVRECCAKQRHPVRFLCEAMGCSTKTAGRMLSTSEPYTALMKRAYAVAFSRSMGYPLEIVTRPVDPDYQEALHGWMRIGPASLATKSAAALGAGIATRCMCVFGMLADFTVTHGPDGRPATVNVTVDASSGRIARHTIVIAESSFTNGPLLTHFDSNGNQRCQIAPNEEGIDRLLRTLKK